MSLQYILGRAGSGKSKYMIDALTEQLLLQPEKKIILLVPEQATFQFERSIAQNPQINGILSLQVMSFQRLAWFVLQETGGLAKHTLNDLGKIMLLRKELLDNKDHLTLIHNGANRLGYMEKLSDMIAEFKQYQLTPQFLSKQDRKSVV